VAGRIYCGTCLQKYWAHDHEHAAPPKEAHYYSPRPARGGVSFGLLLFFSLMPPGINYMYEGLIKRGLFVLSSFFLSFYLAVTLSEPIFGILISIIWVACVFDAFSIRRRLIAGERVVDSVDDILGFFKKYKTAVILFLVVVLGLNLLGSIGKAISYMPYVRYIHPLISSRIVPVLILLGGIYLIVFSGKRSGASSRCCDHTRDDSENK
jgi:hypothetical protein